MLTENDKRKGYYFTHKSGENNKCSENYADSDLLAVSRMLVREN